jgi:hypothetical protein
MSIEVTLWAFIGWIIAGMGFRVGWGLIGLLLDLMARAVSKGGKPG